MPGERTPDPLSKALAEPSRRALLENLQFGRRTVSELVRATGLKQPNVSNHLAKMRQEGLVRAERVGRQVYYSLAIPFANVLLRMHDIASSTLPLQGSEMVALSQETSTPPKRGVSHEQKVEWRETLPQILLEGNESEAVILVNAMLAQRMPLEEIYEEIFQPCLYAIGEMYQRHLIDEAREHLASAIIERLMARVAQFYTPLAQVGCRAVLGCVAGNWHYLGLRMLADALHAMGWEALFLGPNVPTPSFVQIVQASRPQLAVISIAMEEQLPEALRLLKMLRDVKKHHEMLIAVGGHFVDDHPERLPLEAGEITAPSLSGFVQQVQVRWPHGCIETLKPVLAVP